MKSQCGVTEGGELMKPQQLPEEQNSDTQNKPAPAPGIPMSEEEYKRLKEKAEHAPAPRVEHAQEDRPKKSK